MSWLKQISSNPSRTQRCCSRIYCGSEGCRKVIAKCLWFISTARNAIVVIIFSIVAYCLDPQLPDVPTRNTTFILTGNIQSGLPPFKLPSFSYNDTATGQVQGFAELMSEMGSTLILVPLLAVLESVAIAKSFCEHTLLSLFTRQIIKHYIYSSG